MKKPLATLAQRLLGDSFFDLLYWWYFFRRRPAPANNKPNILIVNHVFDQDLQALALANHDYNFIEINAFTLRIAADHLFPRSVESFKVYNSPELQPIRSRYRRIMNRFSQKLVKSYHLQAVVSPSDNFFYVREWIPALRQQYIPFFVVDKEGTICPAYFTHFAQYIKDYCPLLADHILVWSQRQKEFWMKTGVEDSRITVTGQPRSDFWKQPHRWLKKNELGLARLRSDAKLLLFFTYDPWAYTPDYMMEQGEMHWDVLRQETHRVIFDYAKAHPEHDVVIKAHPQQLDKQDLQNAIDASGCTNVFLATGPTLSNHLIVNADCIVGFQTTSLIESMVTDKPIIYTFWREAKEKWSQDLIPFHTTKGIALAESPGMLRQLLETHMQQFTLTAEQRQARDQFLKEYFTVVDGQRSKATLDAISQLLAQHHG